MVSHLSFGLSGSSRRHRSAPGVDSRIQPQCANAKFSQSEPLDVGMMVILSMKDYLFHILFVFVSGAVT
jgi:hypothetical protein